MLIRSLAGLGVVLTWVFFFLWECSRYSTSVSDFGTPFLTFVVFATVPIINLSMWGSLRESWSKLSLGRREVVAFCQVLQWLAWVGSAIAVIFIVGLSYQGDL